MGGSGFEATASSSKPVRAGKKMERSSRRLSDHAKCSHLKVEASVVKDGRSLIIHGEEAPPSLR